MRVREMGFIGRWMEGAMRAREQTRSPDSKAAHPIFDQGNDELKDSSTSKTFRKKKNGKECLTLEDLRSVFAIWALGLFGVSSFYFVVVEMAFHHYYYSYHNNSSKISLNRWLPFFDNLNEELISGYYIVFFRYCYNFHFL